jgi:uncharacterized protein YjbI with pentapeptide repeats
MKTYTKSELDKILADHKAWLIDSSEGERANLSHADLSSADLSSAELSSVITTHNKYLINIYLGNYPMVAFMQDGELLITAGCHRGWTIDKALNHWQPENMEDWTVKTAEYGEQQLRMVEFLMAEAKHLGWIE